MNTLTQQFIAEVRDYLDEAARGFLALEQSAHDQAVINGIFRNFHTIKGTSGIFPEFAPITTLTHAAEDLMDQIRNGEREITTDMVDMFLTTLDLLSSWIDYLNVNEALPADASSSGESLRNRILAILHAGSEIQEIPLGLPVGADAVNDERRDLIRAWLNALDEAGHARLHDLSGQATAPLQVLCYQPDPGCFFFGEDPVNLFRQLDGVVLLKALLPDPFPEPDAFDPFNCSIGFIAVLGTETATLESVFSYVMDRITLLTLDEAQKIQPPTVAVDEHASGQAMALELGEPDVEAVRAEPVDVAAPVAIEASKKGGASFIRVDQELINRFMDLVGEIIIAKNGLPYICQKADKEYGVPQLAGEIDASFTTINHIVNGLQDVAMEMRMLPVAKAFERFPRLVRDISRKLGKKIALVMEGEDTCADKDIIEALSEPLVHMVRNSLDHGIESPEQRVATGKNPEGRITLRALQENASIVVEISDDGKGIDPEVIRRKAAEKGVATVETLGVMPDEEVIQLVMAPNFSTADAISDLSGRGVGMDAVNTMVTSFGGSIRLSSVLGKGTTVRLALPLSMAITKVLIVRQGGCTFGVPADDVIESLIDIPHSMINTVRTAPGLNVRGDLLPLYSLERQLAIKGAHAWFPEAFSAVVVRVRGEVVALGVEGFSDIIDVVVKPLHGMLAQTPHYTGCTILGDGSIMFILNLAEVIADAN